MWFLQYEKDREVRSNVVLAIWEGQRSKVNVVLQGEKDREVRSNVVLQGEKDI